MFGLIEIEMYGYGLYIVGIVFSLFGVIFNNDRSEEGIAMRYNQKITIILSIMSLIISTFYSIYLRMSGFGTMKIEYYFGVLMVSLVFILAIIPGIHGFINRKIIKDVSFHRLNNYGLYIGFCCLIILIITATGYFDDAYGII